MRPREKLIKFGIDSLDNNELIALILGHGTKNEDVFSISKRLIEEYGANPLLSVKSVQELSSFYQIGHVQASKLLASFELGRRLFGGSSIQQIKILKAEDVFKYMYPLCDFNKEYIYGLYLNTRNTLIHEEILSIGSLESSSIHIKDIFYPAIIHNCYSVILVHNHPSEDTSPSESDMIFTSEVEKAASLLQISFLDHVILTKTGFYSFSEN